jgi:hypothetical protein
MTRVPVQMLKEGFKFPVLPPGGPRGDQQRRWPPGFVAGWSRRGLRGGGGGGRYPATRSSQHPALVFARARTGELDLHQVNRDTKGGIALRRMRGSSSKPSDSTANCPIPLIPTRTCRPHHVPSIRGASSSSAFRCQFRPSGLRSQRSERRESGARRGRRQGTPPLFSPAWPLLRSPRSDRHKGRLPSPARGDCQWGQQVGRAGAPANRKFDDHDKPFSCYPSWSLVMASRKQPIAQG